MDAPSDLIGLAGHAADRYQLDRALVCAVIEQESDWDTWAARYEPDFETRYIRPLGLNPTLAKLSAISWGLMQVMGQAAREFGYAGALPSLCLPLNGIEIGCKVLAHKMAVNEGNQRRALLAYNGGANANYADEVLARMAVYA